MRRLGECLREGEGEPAGHAQHRFAQRGERGGGVDGIEIVARVKRDEETDLTNTAPPCDSTKNGSVYEYCSL